ncbi:VanW family protein [Peptoniphilus timonensis]|uniref:VanW family protein n=1 Tax=Peptoniphilus timonensis TaxID=1268254 RepID=UPI0002DD855A|nr:VanW family protein [Peptoniphilus timonensis]
MKIFKNKKFLMVIVGIVIVIFLIYYFIFSKEKLNEEEIDISKIEIIDESKLGRIKEGVTLKNLDFENLTRDKAKSKLSEKQEDILEGKINFKFGDIKDVRTNPRTLTYKLSDIGYEIDYTKTLDKLLKASENDEVKPIFKLNSNKFADFSDALFADVSLEPVNDKLIPVYDKENNKLGYSDPEKVFVKSQYEKGVDGRKLDSEKLKAILSDGYIGEIDVPIEVIKRKEIDPNMVNKSLELLDSMTFKVKPLSLDLNEKMESKITKVYERNNSILMNYLNNVFVSPYGVFDLDRYLMTEKDLEDELYKNRLARFGNGIDEYLDDFLEVKGAGISQGLSNLYEILLYSNFEPINVSHYSYYDPIFNLGLDVKYDEKKPFILKNNSSTPILLKAKTVENENREVTYSIQIFGIATDYQKSNISTKVINKTEPKTIYIKADEIDKDDIRYKGRQGLKVSVFKNLGNETKQIDEVNYIPLDNVVVQ